MQYYKSLYRILTVYTDSYTLSRVCTNNIPSLSLFLFVFVCGSLLVLSPVMIYKYTVIVSIHTPWCTTYFHLTCSSLTLMSFTLLMLPHPECRDRTLGISILTLDLYLNLLPFRYKLLKRRFKTRPSRV